MRGHLNIIDNTQMVNASIILNQAINQLSRAVSDCVYFRQVEAENFLIIELLNKALYILIGTTVKSDVVEYINRAIERLSIAVNEEIAQEDVENVNDDVVDLLGAALNRLGYDRCAK